MSVLNYGDPYDFRTRRALTPAGRTPEMHAMMATPNPAGSPTNTDEGGYIPPVFDPSGVGAQYGGVGGDGGDGGAGIEFPGWDFHAYGGPYGYDPGDAPGFEPPPDFVAPEFTAPTLDETNDPGYAFRLSQGLGALQSAAAAKGILQTGGTLKDLMNYGQNFASAEYSNVFNRALDAYERDYRGARDEYDTRYKTAQDKYQSEYDPWALRAQMGEHANDQRYNAWQALMQDRLGRGALFSGLLG